MNAVLLCCVTVLLLLQYPITAATFGALYLAGRGGICRGGWSGCVGLMKAWGFQ